MKEIVDSMCCGLCLRCSCDTEYIITLEIPEKVSILLQKRKVTFDFHIQIFKDDLNI